MTNTRELMCEAISHYPFSQISLPDISLVGKKQKSMLDIFKEKLTKASVKWFDLGSNENVKTFLRKLHPEADTICSAVPEVRGDKNINHIFSPSEFNNMDITVIRAEFGVAQDGMVWIAEKSMPIRTLKHITRHLVILLDPDRLVRNMQEAYEEVYYNENNYGSFLLGISDIYPTEFDNTVKEEEVRPLSITVCFI